VEMCWSRTTAAITRITQIYAGLGSVRSRITEAGLMNECRVYRSTWLWLQRQQPSFTQKPTYSMNHPWLTLSD
jgi:hypothetical protein